MHAQMRNEWWVVVGVTLWLLGPGSGGLVLAQEKTSLGPKAGDWSGGVSVGFLANTPDSTVFGLNFHADRFLSRDFSVGPLAQLGFGSNLTLAGFSGQGKYWIDLPGLSDRTKMNLQAGLGFVHADMGPSDTSWLIPIGIGIDHAVADQVALTANFMLNFTNLDLGGGRSTTIMPGLTFGIRF